MIVPNHFNLPKSCFGRTWGNHSWELCHRYKMRFIYSSTSNTEIIRKSGTDERNTCFLEIFFFVIWFTFCRVSVANLHFQQGLNTLLTEIIGQMNTRNESVLGVGSRVHVLHASAASWGFQSTMLSLQSLLPGPCSLISSLHTCFACEPYLSYCSTSEFRWCPRTDLYFHK